MEKSKAEKSKAENSWDNLCHYSYTKAQEVDKFIGEDNCIPLMDEFIGAYPNGIRGHASGTKSSKKNAQTTQDLEVFTEWLNTKISKLKEGKKGKKK